MNSPIIQRAIDILHDADYKTYKDSFNFEEYTRIYDQLYPIFKGYIISNLFSIESDADVVYAYNHCEVMMKIYNSKTYRSLKTKGLDEGLVKNPICFMSSEDLCLHYIRRVIPRDVKLVSDVIGKPDTSTLNKKLVTKNIRKSSNFGIACDVLGILNKKQKKIIENKDGVWYMSDANQIISFRDILNILNEIHLNTIIL